MTSRPPCADWITPMAEAGEASDFVREYTLASGGPYCDCGYHKKQK